MSSKAKGKQLTLLASLYGVHRRWWGLEPDFILRKRILSITAARPWFK